MLFIAFPLLPLRLCEHSLTVLPQTPLCCDAKTDNFQAAGTVLVILVWSPVVFQCLTTVLSLLLQVPWNFFVFFCIYVRHYNKFLVYT